MRSWNEAALSDERRSYIKEVQQEKCNKGSLWGIKISKRGRHSFLEKAGGISQWSPCPDFGTIYQSIIIVIPCNHLLVMGDSSNRNSCFETAITAAPRSLTGRTQKYIQNRTWKGLETHKGHDRLSYSQQSSPVVFKLPIGGGISFLPKDLSRCTKKRKLHRPKITKSRNQAPLITHSSQQLIFSFPDGCGISYNIRHRSRVGPNGQTARPKRDVLLCLFLNT